MGSYDAQDGTKKYTNELFIDSFEFVEKSNNISSNNNENIDNYDYAFAEPVDDGDLPF